MFLKVLKTQLVDCSNCWFQIMGQKITVLPMFTTVLSPCRSIGPFSSQNRVFITFPADREVFCICSFSRDHGCFLNPRFNNCHHSVSCVAFLVEASHCSFEDVLMFGFVCCDKHYLFVVPIAHKLYGSWVSPG